MDKGKKDLLHEEFILGASKIIARNESVLLAVSGGVDSVVLFHLFLKSGYKFSVAHCNFKLRGKHSEKDAAFVKELCEEHSIPFFSKEFNTERFAEENGVSIQMAARDLRYDWFNKLSSKEGYSVICTAHHLNDNVETVLLNLSRETGIAGLTGIEARSGKLARPLLFATKERISEFARRNKIKFRKDKSNDEVKYKRNLVRKKLIPLFEKLNPSFLDSFSRSIENFKEDEQLVLKSIEEARRTIVSEEDNEIKIDLTRLKKFPAPGALLYNVLRPYGFEGSVTREVLSLADSQSGREITSSTHRIIVNRKALIVTPVVHKIKSSAQVGKDLRKVEAPVPLLFTKKVIDVKALDGKTIALDLEKLVFPLKVRAWEKGDWFVPFGMKGKKKISDLLIDLKVPKHKKDEIFLLLNGDGKVVWVIGIRADDRFKVEDPTKESVVVKLNRRDYL